MPVRTDRVGLFWEDIPSRDIRHKNANRTPPPVPDTGWTTPSASDLPNLSAADIIAVDVETKDPNLKQQGPGDIRGDGYVAGIAVGVPEKQWYFPIRHDNGANMDLEPVLKWAKDAFTDPRQKKIGANLLYDLHWLKTDGIKVNGPLIDVQYTEALLDEHAMTYALGALGKKYLGEGKDESLLYEWCSQAFGGNATRGAQAGNIWRAPAALVGPYAMSDVRLPFEIWEKQRPEIEAQGLGTIWEIEHKLIHLYFAMRQRGVKVDLGRAEQARNDLANLRDEQIEKIKHIAGRSVEIWSGPSIARAFDAIGEPYKKTPTGKPSFTKEWLNNCGNPVAQAIVDARKYDKAISTFIDGHILGGHVNGRIHASIHPLRSVADGGESSGTVSGRFSYSNPNLQQIPSRDKEMGRILRGCFTPDEEHRYWNRGDYSQIEYRLMAHYARGPGADALRQLFNDDPNTDYHESTRQQIREVTGILLDRKPTKNINFGLIYGMGKGKLIRSLGLSEAKGNELYDAYHQGVPFVKTTTDMIINRAKSRGFIKTILGRRARFPEWEPTCWDLRGLVRPSPDREKVAAEIDSYVQQGNNYFPGLTRSRTHKAPNSLMQGGAADVMKKAMLDLFESGVFDVTGVPLVTVHDELDFSDPGTPETEEAFREVKRMMEETVKLTVPLQVDFDRGADWGECL